MTALYHCNVSQKILFIPNQTQNTAAGVQINDKRRPGVGQTHKFSPFALSLAISSHWWQNVCSAALAWMLQFVWPLFGPFAALFICSVTVRTCEMSSSVKWNNRKCINTEVQHFSWENDAILGRCGPQRCYIDWCPVKAGTDSESLPLFSQGSLRVAGTLFTGRLACRLAALSRQRLMSPFRAKETLAVPHTHRDRQHVNTHTCAQGSQHEYTLCTRCKAHTVTQTGTTSQIKEPVPSAGATDPK